MEATPPRRRFLFTFCVSAIVGIAMTALPPEAPAKPDSAAAPKLEPLVALIEPAVMRTELARPFANGRQTIIVPAREEETGLTRYSKEEFEAAGLTWETFLKKAEETATRHLVSLKPEIVRDAKGNVSHGVLKTKRPLAPGVVLSPRFLPLFQEQFGERIVVLMPDQFTVYLFPRRFSDFQSFGPRVLKEFDAAVWPCSLEAFEVSRDGVRCLGAFEDGDEEPPSPAPSPPAGPAKSKAK